MNIPMMWMAVGSVVGSIFWSFIGPLPLTSVLLTLTFTVWLRVAPPRRFRFLIAMIGFCLSGVSMPTARTAVATTKHLIGTIVERHSFGAMVRTTDGDVWIRLTDPPRTGENITALVTPHHHASSMPGAYSSSTLRTIRDVPAVRAISWSVMGAPLPPKTNRYWAIHAGVIHALSTGDRSQVHPSTLRLMQTTGTVHLLAISGLHVGMAASMGWMMGWVASRPLIRWPIVARITTTLAALGMAWCYGSMVSWPISTQRAFCMVGVVAVCRLMDRKTDPWHAWALALLLVTILQPHHINSIGMWMSFGAVAALIGWTKQWTSWMPISSASMRWVARSLFATTAATLGIMPVSAWVFQELSIGAPLSNLMAVPLMTLVGVPTALLATHGPGFIREFSTLLCDFSIESCLLWLRWTDLGVIHPAVGPFGAVLLAIAIFLYQKPRWALVLVMAALIRPEARSTQFQLTFPNVGQGGSALVEFPDGRRWLIDGGPPGKQLLHWLRRRGVRSLDAVYLTHPDMDHLGGLIPVLESISVDTLWSSRRPYDNEPVFHNFWRDAALRGTELKVQGNTHTENDNENSLVLRLRHGQHQFLLTGDIGAQTEQKMLPFLVHFDVLQVPHHGSNGSSTNKFIQKINPVYAVIQSGRGNRYGHPHPQVIERLKSKNLLRTDLFGSVSFRSDGSNLSVRTTWSANEQKKNGNYDHVKR